MDSLYNRIGAGKRQRPSRLTSLTIQIAAALEKSTSENEETTDRRLCNLTKVSLLYYSPPKKYRHCIGHRMACEIQDRMFRGTNNLETSTNR